MSSDGVPFSLERGDMNDVLWTIQNTTLSGPILDASDITDYGAVGFVADPFLHIADDLHLFFEVYNPVKRPTASIGHATSNDGGATWIYDRIVFSIDRHASFPFVFETDGEIYMVPGLANTDDEITPARLYRATSFPGGWKPVADIVDADHACTDSVVFYHDDLWWAIIGGGDNDELYVYFSDTLETPGWDRHPENPVVTGRQNAGRPAGRPIVRNDRLLIPLQNCHAEYGSAVELYEVTTLTPEAYDDQPLFTDPLLQGQGLLGWNSGRMHHLDLQFVGDEILCAVDGDVGLGRNRASGSMWSIGFGTSGVTFEAH